MTFEWDILGDARWPTSTRLGHQTQSRMLLLRGYDRDVRQLRRHRTLSAPLLWLPRMALRESTGCFARPVRRWMAVSAAGRLEGCRPAAYTRLYDAEFVVRIRALEGVPPALPPPRIRGRAPTEDA